jgi:diguanylate cyclase
MSSESVVSSKATPDRFVTRACATVLGASMLLMAAGNLAADRMVQLHGQASELALIGAQQSALSRRIVDGLTRMLTLPPGPERGTAQTNLAWEIEQLVAQDRVRLSVAHADSGSNAQQQELNALLLEAEASLIGAGGTLEPDHARALKKLFEEQLAPRYDLMALRLEADAERRRNEGRTAIFGLLALQSLGLLGLVAGVAMPAVRRTRAWVRHATEAERESRHRLLHDPLTQLPNGTYLHAFLSRAVAEARRMQRPAAVLRIDIERFKVLRETLGARTADEIIRIFARRIQHSLRVGDFAAHLGHEDFVVVAIDLEDRNAAAAIAHRLQMTLDKPFSIRGTAQRVSSSMGVTLLSDDEPEADRILGNAEIALSEAQGMGGGSIRYFDDSMRLEVERREALLTELMTGLERGELVPFFQPQLELGTGRLRGFEALARWHHPDRGLLTPAAFLDFAEQAGLTERIGEVILSQSLKALKAWDKAGLDVPTVGINFALAQLRNPRLIEKIKWETERLEIEPNRIAIEVLETVLIKSDADMVVRNLRGLASAGFQIDLDDFGTGHASISNLRRFMVTRIKIDRSFVLGIETCPEQQKLTASMIAMARALGIRTLAEGVETAAARDMLAGMGCDDFQGYFIARPMGYGETLDWLRSQAPSIPPALARVRGPKTP